MVEACKDLYEMKDYKVMSQMPYGQQLICVRSHQG